MKLNISMPLAAVVQSGTNGITADNPNGYCLFVDNTPVFLPARIFDRILTLALLPKTLSRPVIATLNITMMSKSMPGKAAYHSILGPVITSYRYTHYDSSDAGSSYSNMISVRLKDPRGAYTQLWLSRGTGAYTYDWTPETRYGSMKSISLQRIQPLTEQLNLGLTAGKVWFNTQPMIITVCNLQPNSIWKF